MLRADSSVIKERFLQRGWKPHLVDDAIREVAELEHAKFTDIRVDTVNHSIKEIARMVRAQAGDWPGLS
jgi:broad-specificity NMP kinase